MNRNQKLLTIFNTLLTTFGKRNWWPGETTIEIMVGAVLTQNTSWKNVEKAIGNMKREGLLDMGRLQDIDVQRLSEVIRPAGFFNIKSRRLKNFVEVMCSRFGGRIESLSAVATNELRSILLDIKGIGPETADSILLYALERPVFVVDAYTKRFLKNHRLYDGNDDYHSIQEYFMKNLPSETYLFNEFHALIVRLAQVYCRKVPLCSSCPLRDQLG
jgi:endonuclease III related protein